MTPKRIGTVLAQLELAAEQLARKHEMTPDASPRSLVRVSMLLGRAYEAAVNGDEASLTIQCIVARDLERVLYGSSSACNRIKLGEDTP